MLTGKVFLAQSGRVPLPAARYALPSTVVPLVFERTRELDWRRALRLATASVAGVFTLLFAFWNGHTPFDIHAGVVAQVIELGIPALATATAVYAVLRPWPAFVLILALTPVFDAAQISRFEGPFQILLQTVFLAALGAGVLLRDRPAQAGVAARADAAAHPADAANSLVRRAFANPYRLGFLATAAFLALATLSTLFSSNVAVSSLVLIHGIYEPIGMAAVFMALVRTRRQLWTTLIALALSAALGSLLNVLQSVPAMGSLHVLQAQRLLFSRLTYFNVGLFGEIVAMAAPLLIAAIARRRQLGLGRRLVALLIAATVVSIVGLFLTFSKSAYLAAAGGVLIFLFLLVNTWRSRAAIVGVTLAISAFIVPWPAVALRVVPPLESLYRSAMIQMVGASRYYSWDPAYLPGRGSLLERLYATEAAIQMGIDHPILGVGLDLFGREYVEYYQTPQSHFAADSAHTFWPEIAAELGIPALIAVVLIYLSAFLLLFRLYRAPPDAHARLLAVTLLGSLVAWVMVASAFAGDMYRSWRHMSSDFVMMAILVAAAFVLYRIVRSEAQARAARAA